MSTRARSHELDVLRGVLLVVMTVTHLPTRLSVVSHSIFGYVSAAEGFVFLSAYLAAVKYRAAPVELLLRRAAKLYSYHLLLLLFGFTIAAQLQSRPALRAMFEFFLADPYKASAAALALVYCPPLLDILPMYVLFLACTPFALRLARQWGAGALLALSASVWLCGQLGAREWLQQHAGAPFGGVPASAFGAFNFLGWQLLWMLGLCLGLVEAGAFRRVLTSNRLILSSAACGLFLVLRCAEHWGFVVDVPYALDKWRLAPLRLINLLCLVAVLVHYGPRWVSAIGGHALSILGRASLSVFCLHLVLCLCFNLLLEEADGRLPGWQEALVLLTTLGTLLVFAATRVALPGRVSAATSPTN